MTNTIQNTEQIDALAVHYGLPAYSELLRAHEYRQQDEARKEDASKHARDSASCAVDGINGMVAAMNCDYSRLEELRDERDGYVHSIEGPEEMDTPEQWAIENPEDAEELRELETAAGDCESEDDARQHIDEDPLEISVRSDWHAPGEEGEPDEFKILLTTGGPAVRIVGELDQYRQPCRAWLEYQDWFTPWTEYHGDNVDSDALLAYCQCFYFGD